MNFLFYIRNLFYWSQNIQSMSLGKLKINILVSSTVRRETFHFNIFLVFLKGNPMKCLVAYFEEEKKRGVERRWGKVSSKPVRWRKISVFSSEWFPTFYGSELISRSFLILPDLFPLFAEQARKQNALKRNYNFTDVGFLKWNPSSRKDDFRFLCLRLLKTFLSSKLFISRDTNSNEIESSKLFLMWNLLSCFSSQKLFRQHV